VPRLEGLLIFFNWFLKLFYNPSRRRKERASSGRTVVENLRFFVEIVNRWQREQVRVFLLQQIFRFH
jgi:hypothetical protein